MSLKYKFLSAEALIFRLNPQKFQAATALLKRSRNSPNRLLPKRNITRLRKKIIFFQEMEESRQMWHPAMW